MIQTWLPLPNFTDSIATLRTEELGLQRYHVLEIMEHFHTPENSQMPADYDDWHNLDGHPIVGMWTGYELQLVEYGLEVCEEWSRRRGKADPFHQKLSYHLDWAMTEEAVMAKPNWFGDVDFHLSHQAALLKKDRKHYSRYFLADGARNIVWPVSDHAS
jgi:hypothetical protein